MNDDSRFALKTVEEHISDEFGNGLSQNELEKLKGEILLCFEKLKKHTIDLYEADILDYDSNDGLDVDDFDYELYNNK